MRGGSELYPQELIDSAEALTKLVATDAGFDETMQRLADLAVHAVEGADRCSVTLVRAGREVKNVAATTDRARRIDELQAETGEGPCLSSIEDHKTFHIADMAREERWPQFTTRALEEAGARSMLSFVLRLSEDATGAMNMISSEVDAFTSDDLDTGTLFAAQAAVAMGDALGHQRDQEEIAQLKVGMETRQMIGQAVGILMSSRQVGADEAYEILKKASQNSNIKLREIASRVVDKAKTV